MLTVYCDGGARGNPGPAASAFLIYEGDKEIKRFSKYLGVATNNSAEYQAVILALNYISKNIKVDLIDFNLDSELVTKQLKGEYKVKNENLKKLFLEIKKLERIVRAKINYSWTKRENNKPADLLVNQELDRHII